MKRPTDTALRAALYSMIAGRDETPKGETFERSVRVAARTLVALMKLPQSDENIKDAQTELARACIMIGLQWRGTAEVNQ